MADTGAREAADVVSPHEVPHVARCNEPGGEKPAPGDCGEDCRTLEGTPCTPRDRRSTAEYDEDDPSQRRRRRALRQCRQRQECIDRPDRPATLAVLERPPAAVEQRE